MENGYECHIPTLDPYELHKSMKTNTEVCFTTIRTNFQQWLMVMAIVDRVSLGLLKEILEN